jgi:hypothetical protein
MGSINALGSTLNSINQSLLTELSSYLPAKNTASTGSTAAVSGDSVNFSQVGQLFQELQQLQTSDPTALKKVLEDAATKFSTAAQQATDPTQASVLSNLADRFQKAADTGDLSALQKPSSSASASGTYGVQGHHHHHHHGGGGSAPSTSSADSTTASSPTTEDLLATLFNQPSTPA